MALQGDLACETAYSQVPLLSCGIVLDEYIENLWTRARGRGVEGTACGGGVQALCAVVLWSPLQSVGGTVKGSQEATCPIVFNDEVIWRRNTIKFIDSVLQPTCDSIITPTDE